MLQVSLKLHDLHDCVRTQKHVFGFWPNSKLRRLSRERVPYTRISSVTSTLKTGRMASINSSSYLAFISSRIVDWNHREGDKAVSVVQLTPLGASAAWCTEPKTWSHSLISTDVNDVHASCVLRRTIIYHLFLNAKRINDKLLRSLRALDWETRSTARNAFSVTGQLNEWFHDIIQTLLADRFIWAYRKPASPDMRSFQVAHGVGVQHLTPRLEKFHDHLEKWRETVSNFVELWESSQVCSNARIISRGDCPVSASPKEGQFQAILETLYASIQESDLAKVENNFCRASLGLIALKLVCPFSLCGTRLRDRPMIF